jgi:elongation factor Ts
MAVKVTAKMVKELRDITGAGPLDCKKALEETGGDVDKAVEYLQKKGMAKARKKLGKGRTMNEGVVEVYQHFNSRLAVIAEVNCETDFVAQTEQFQTFARDIVLHISSMRPKYVTREEVPADLVAAEKEVQKAQPDMEGKPDDIKEKIVEGRLDKWYKEIVLMEQDFLKDDSKTIQELLEETVAELGESIEISRFARYELGEGGAGDEDSDDEE